MVALLTLVGTAGAADAPEIYKKKCDETWLREYFKEPKSKVENAKMPKMPLSDAEWTAIVQYMLSLTGTH